MNRHRAFTVLRWLAATALGLWTARQFYLVGHAPDGATMYGALHGMYGLGGLLTTVLLISPELADWGAMPLNRMFDAVLLPGESAPPPLDYTLARFYLQQMRYEEACEEYLKIIHYHPRALPAYLEGMASAGRAGRADLAARLHRRGRRVFRERKIRERLQHVLDDSLVAAAEAVQAEEPAPELLPELTDEDAPPPEPPEP